MKSRWTVWLFLNGGRPDVEMVTVYVDATTAINASQEARKVARKMRSENHSLRAISWCVI